MRSMKRLSRVVGLVAVLALVLAACGGDEAEDTTTTTAAPTTTTEAPTTTTTEAPTTTEAEETTTTTEVEWAPLYDGDLALGYVLPSTGGLSVIAPSLIEAFNMAISEIEAAGNDAITVSPKDSGTDPQVASSSVDELLNEGVSAIVGPASTQISLAVIDRVTGAGVPMCSPSNTGAVFTTYDDDGFYFRTSPPDNLQGAVHADMITDDGASSVAIAFQGSEYGRGLAEAIRDQLEANGVSVPAFVEFDPQATSFDAEAAEIAAAGVDAISIHGYAELNGLVQALIEAGVGPSEVALYGGDGFVDSVQAETVDPENPAVLEGTRATYPSLSPPDGEATFVDRFSEFAPDVPTIFSGHTYDCVVSFVLAAEQAGSTDPADIAAEMNDVTRDGEKCQFYRDCHILLQLGVDIDYDGASGPLDFVDAGEPGAGTYDLVTYQADGSRVTDATVSIP